jgi:hypothetical protein
MFTTSEYSGLVEPHGKEGDVFWIDCGALSHLDLANGLLRMVDVMCDSSIHELYISGGMETYTDWNGHNL